MSVTADATMLPRGTPLYGQPSWWGDGDADDENSFKQESKPSSKKHDGSLSGRPHAHARPPAGGRAHVSVYEPIVNQLGEPKSARASLDNWELSEEVGGRLIMHKHWSRLEPF